MKVLNHAVSELIKEKSFSLMSAASIVSITDLNGTIIYANENFSAISRYPVKELLGKNHNIFNSGHHPTSMWADMWKIISAGKVWHKEVKNKTKDGQYYWVDSKIIPIRDPEGKISAYLSVHNDITHQKNQEAAALNELKASELHYKFLYHNTPIMYFTLEPSGIVRSVNKFGATQLGYEPEQLIGKSVLLVFPSALHQEVSNHLATCVAQPNKPFYWEIQKIKADHSLIWVREVAWAETDPHGEILVTVACQDITEMKTSTQALHTENKLLVEGPTVAFKWKAVEGWPVEFVSANVVSVFGYSSNELMSGSIPYSTVIHPEDIDRVANEVTAYSVSGVDTFTQEYRIITKTGKCRWIKDYTAVMRDERGLVTHYRGHIHDITEPKLAREEILLINARLTSLIESIPDAIFFKDGESRWLITNEAAKKLFKLNEIDWMGKTELQLADLHPDFRVAHETCLIDEEKAWQARKLTLFTEFAMDEHGATREYEVRKMPIFNEDGSRKALVIIGSDITDRRQAEVELKRTKKSLEQTMRLAKIGGWEADYVNGTISWFGLTREIAEVPDDYVPNFDTIMNFYKEGESRNRMEAAMVKAMEEGVGFELELQLVSAKGKEYWVKTIAEPKMVNGKCEKIYGYFQDITEQIELDKKNRAIERKFSRLIEKSTDAIVLQDAAFKVIYFSPAAGKFLGYPQAEVIGENPISLYHPDDIAHVLERRELIINGSGESFPIAVTRVRHKDGHYVNVEGTITNLLKDPDVQALVSNFRDVTEKKLIEDGLKAKNNRLEEIAWLFSHEVRGPVATIMGLVSLFNHSVKTDPINEEVLAKILIPIHRLDDIIVKIVRLTNEIEAQLPAFQDEKGKSEHSRS